MTITNEILVPVVVLVAWSLVQWLWMYATRLPAIKASGMTLDATIPNGEQMASLPSKARWKADNYNHLMEQPTVFYALAISMALLGLGDGLNETLAWAYVGLRIVHSLFQSLVNKIELRFMLFALSNVPLFWLTINALTSLS
jgi:hypothetical protein